MRNPDGYISSIVTRPTVPILSTAEAKAQLRVDGSDEDTLIDAFVSAADTMLDAEHGIIGRALTTQRWRLSLTSPPASNGHVYLPVPPVQSVHQIQYYDTDGALQTYSSDNYRLVVDSQYAVVELVSGASWPATDNRLVAFYVDYDTGYGNTAADIPEAIRQAARLLVGHYNENRQAVVTGVTPNELPLAVQSLIMPFKISRAMF